MAEMATGLSFRLKLEVFVPFSSGPGGRWVSRGVNLDEFPPATRYRFRTLAESVAERVSKASKDAK